MSVPTHGEQFAKLLEHLRSAQDGSAMLAHLTRAQSSSKKDMAVADGWIAVQELLSSQESESMSVAMIKLDGTNKKNRNNGSNMYYFVLEGEGAFIIEKKISNTAMPIYVLRTSGLWKIIAPSKVSCVS